MDWCDKHITNRLELHPKTSQASKQVLRHKRKGDTNMYTVKIRVQGVDFNFHLDTAEDIKELLVNTDGQVEDLTIFKNVMVGS